MLEHGDAAAIQRLDDFIRRLPGLRRPARRSSARRTGDSCPVNSCCGSDGALPPGSIPKRCLMMRRILSEERVDFVCAPQIERPLRFVRARRACLLRRHAVGVLGAVEAAVEVGHLAEHIQQRVFGNLQVKRIAGGLRRLRRRRARAAPGRTTSSRNAARARRRRPSSGEIRRRCDRACRQSPSRAGCEGSCPAQLSRQLRAAGSRVLAQQEQQLRRPRKFRRVAKTAVARVKGRLELPDRPIERLAPWRRGCRPAAAIDCPSARSCAVSASADCVTFARSARQTCATCCRISVKPGRPQRADGGK